MIGGYDICLSGHRCSSAVFDIVGLVSFVANASAHALACTMA